MFHSARWDYDYTGGDASGGLDKLADKRVALVGTGATGVQLVPHLGRDAKHLYVFQRTPSSVDVRGNKPTDPEWAKSLQPGWQEERKRNFHSWSPFGEGAVFGQPDLVCDFWTELARNMTARISTREDPASLSIEQIMAIHEEEDYKVMERLRRHVEAVVEDPETAEALKPYYRFMCKRPCSNDEYLPTFNRPNVTLVDVSESQGRRTGSPRTGSSPTALSTKSIASSSRADSRSRRRSVVGMRSTPSRAATGCRSSTTGGTATRRCTG